MPTLTPDLYQNYLKHLKLGYSKESFVEADYQWIEKNIKLDPTTYPPEELKQAERMNLYFWEELSMRSMLGEDPKFNNSLFALLMKTRFGWGSKPEKSEGTKPYAASDARYTWE